MRKVSYFYGGQLADFVIPDDRFEEFSKHLKWETRHSETDVEKARGILEICVVKGDDAAVGQNEILAACFVWNFFNTNPDDQLFIDGDVVIVDLEGNGNYVDYVAASEIQLTQDA
jgi:hypothetical protein